MVMMAMREETGSGLPQWEWPDGGHAAVLHQTRLLIVEDDRDLCESLSAAIEDRLHDLDVHVDRAGSLAEAMPLMTEAPYDGYLLDYGLHDGTGMDLLERLRADDRDEPVIFLTGRDDAQMAVQALKSGASDYLVKGEFSVEFLGESIRHALQRHQDDEKRSRAQLALSEDAAQLAAIIETQHAIATAKLDFKQMMRLVVERTRELTHAAGAAIGCLDGDEVVYRVGSGVGVNLVGRRFPLDRSLCGCSLLAADTLFSQDAQKDDRLDGSLYRELGIRSVIVLPLHYDREVVAVLKVYSPEANAFSSRDVHTLELMGTLIAAAATHASRFEALQSLAAERMAALQESEAKLQWIVSQIPAVLWTTDTELRITSADGAALNALRVDMELCSGWSLYEVFGTEDPDFWAIAAHRKALRGQAASYEHRTRDRQFEVRVEPLRNAQGAVIGCLSLALDITTRTQMEEDVQALHAQLEDRVRVRTTQLEASNRELEAFSYSVAHDLQEPLRRIDGFSQILIEDYADMVDPEGQDYLRRIRKGSQRMGELIDDLLSLSQVTRGTIQREVVNLSAIVRSVLKDLEEQFPEREASVEIADGILAKGDPRLLQILIGHLLENAWKFTRLCPVAQITFGRLKGRRSEGGPIYFVRDNGAGFDMEYAHKLFRLFQRLHFPEEFEGAGVGLATAERIVQRHGGRIWGEGAVGNGAAFYFTL